MKQNGQDFEQSLRSKMHVIMNKRKTYEWRMTWHTKYACRSHRLLKVDRLEGSTYHLLGPNSEPIKMNASEVEDDDQLEIGEDYSFFVYPSRSGELFATQNMPTITKDRYDWVKVLRVDRDGAAVDVGLPRSTHSMGRSKLKNYGR